VSIVADRNLECTSNSRQEPSGCIVESCEFCERPKDRAWYDWAELHRSEHFSLVAALGALVPGYVLLVPNRHCHSFLELEDDEARDAIAVLDYIRKVYRHVGLNKFSVFEHGCDVGQLPTGCISHAHWHVIPTTLRVEKFGPEWEQVDSFEEFRATHQTGDYLYLNTESGSHVSGSVPLRQYFRRLLANQIGIPDEWDYLVFPHLSNVQSTIEIFG